LIGIKADKSKRCKVTFPAKVRAIAGEPQMKTTKPLMMIVVLTFLSVMSPLSLSRSHLSASPTYWRELRRGGY
jgi:hypothetical protein